MTELPQATAVLVLVAVLSPDIVAAHGSVSLEEDICVHRVGGNMVHLNAYQPQHEPTAQYCTDIPEAGDTFLVVDLVDPGLRTRPVGVRVVREISEAADEQTVASWPPVSHPDGVVRGEATLDKGLYRIIITADGLSPSSYPLRVQMLDYSKLARQATGPLVGLLLLALVIYELGKSRRLRGWWSSVRS